ncbi:MAG: type II secretion system F family protein [Myxococcales bacterium]|nr:type II secretion system F family protein [Myxococcales bacterium]MDD9968211.1 type II secretion system F family protein [Myxococcales bacterium]
MSTLGTETLRWLGLIGLSVGFAASVTTLMILEQSPVRVAARRYIRGLNRRYETLRLPAKGKEMFTVQLLVIGIIVGLAATTRPLWLVLIPLVAVLPSIYVKKKCQERLERIEEQLDGWLLVLANALKAVPSLGDALESSQNLVHAPLSQELDLAIKEYRLGAPLDAALDNMAERMDSRVVRSALSILRIARNTGGDLPSTLETSAASLREMQRLEGVVRTKTADGKNQAWVLGTLPLVVLIGVKQTAPHILDPLVETLAGNLLLGLAIALWIGAIAAAIKILDVDI